MGAVERVGRGRGTHYFLSKRIYAEIGAPGVYTRKRGLDHETNKALIEQHLRSRGAEGAPLSEIRQVLPAESKSGIQRLLNELRSEDRVFLRGQRRWARWCIASGNG